MNGCLGVAAHLCGHLPVGFRQWRRRELRNLSQPAASQQLASLERRMGLPLFIRTPHGVEPTRRGRELHAQVAESLDRLEPVLAGIDGGAVSPDAASLRLGSSAEFFSYAVVPRLGPESPALSARFGPDDVILDLLEHGELDIAVTSVTPGRRSLTSTPIGAKRFVLVGSPALAPDQPFESLTDLGSWLVGKPWVAFSAELPLTRRFWLSCARPVLPSRSAAGRTGPPCGGRGGGPWARLQPAANLRLRRRTGPRIRGGSASGGGRHPRRALVRLHPSRGPRSGAPQPIYRPADAIRRGMTRPATNGHASSGHASSGHAGNGNALFEIQGARGGQHTLDSSPHRPAQPS